VRRTCSAHSIAHPLQCSQQDPCLIPGLPLPAARTVQSLHT
jgi:hypothetical protein